LVHCGRPYKAWKNNGQNQFEHGRVKKNVPSLDEPLIWSLFLLNKIYMVRAALATATVSSERSMLAHQWLLARAAAAEKHCTYSIFYLNLQQQLKWIALR
jgi:hypothetical protein